MSQSTATRPLAIVTGASSGIGRELAICCIHGGFDLIVAADEPEIHVVAAELATQDAHVAALQVDLATIEGVDTLVAAANGRPVSALLANAGRALGHAFFDQDFAAARKVLDTNVTGTIYLIHQVGRQMRARDDGRILITGSIAGFMPGSFQAVYNGTKAFLDSFSYALRNELKDTKVSVTCLMPGATETEIFERADMLDTRIGAQEKDDAADVARQGYEAMMLGEGQTITGLKSKFQAAMAHVIPADLLAELHRRMAAPGTAPPQN